MPFTPVQTFLGGLLLHVSTSSLLADTGRVFGISGIVHGAIFGTHERWQWAIFSGLIAGPILTYGTGLGAYLPGHGLDSLSHLGTARLALAGGLVGFGTRLGSGCTSGHMLCGVSRLSPRSFVATITFFITAVLTANLVTSPLSPSVSPAYTLDIPPLSTVALLIFVIAGSKIAYSALRRILFRNDSSAFRLTPYFLLGLIFSLGLATSGMNDPAKVRGFLRFPEVRQFDPSLSLIMFSGVSLNALHYHSLNKTTPKPKFPWENWRVPVRKDIDWKLLCGSTIFGVGWGICGICPGPAILLFGEAVARATMHGDGVQVELVGKVMTFLGTMLISMWFGSLI